MHVTVRDTCSELGAFDSSVMNRYVI
jgi:hypothetical protein